MCHIPCTLHELFMDTFFTTHFKIPGEPNLYGTGKYSSRVRRYPRFMESIKNSLTRHPILITNQRKLFLLFFLIRPSSSKEYLKKFSFNCSLQNLSMTNTYLHGMCVHGQTNVKQIPNYFLLIFYE